MKTLHTFQASKQTLHALSDEWILLSISIDDKFCCHFPRHKLQLTNYHQFFCGQLISDNTGCRRTVFDHDTYAELSSEVLYSLCGNN